MNTVEYARMAEQEASYWWHVGRFSLIRTYVGLVLGQRKDAKLLNVGCGTGGTLAVLEAFGTVDNVDTSDEAISYMKSRGYDRLTKVQPGQPLPFDAATYDAVTAFDVLEHIEDDTAALRDWARVLKPGGHVVLTVPAYKWLWSQHDESLHHFRRYTRANLKAAAAGVGLRPVKVSYAIVFSLPLVAGFRLLHGLSGKQSTAETSYVKLPGFINKSFTWLLQREAGLHRVASFPAGTSVVAIFEKDAA